jgi:hypothetical protein
MMVDYKDLQIGSYYWVHPLDRDYNRIGEPMRVVKVVTHPVFGDDPVVLHIGSEYHDCVSFYDFVAKIEVPE